MLGQVTIDKLKAHQDRQQLEKAAAGERWQEHGLIFPTVIGTLSDPHNLLKEFKELLEKAGLPKMRFHDLRHTSITLVLNDIGAPIKEAQRRAGHASPSTTINLYGGEATNKMDDHRGAEPGRAGHAAADRAAANGSEQRAPGEAIDWWLNLEVGEKVHLHRTSIIAPKLHRKRRACRNGRPFTSTYGGTACPQP
jgi:hypothetical protein